MEITTCTSYGLWGPDPTNHVCTLVQGNNYIAFEFVNVVAPTKHAQQGIVIEYILGLIANLGFSNLAMFVLCDCQSVSPTIKLIIN